MSTMDKCYFMRSNKEFTCKPIEEAKVKTKQKKKKNLHKEIIQNHMEKSKPKEN